MSWRRRVRRSVHRQHDGDRLRVPRPRGARKRQRAGERSRKAAVARDDGGARHGVAAREAAARATSSRATALDNAIAAVAATGGSTNAVLHLLAIAREADVPLDLADFDRASVRVPVIADLKPSGRFVATDLHAAGGSALVAQRLIDSGHVDGTMRDGHRPYAPKRKRPMRRKRLVRK